ncbi:MAG: transporter substrate-binding domain-containing protein [Hyphomicrobiales bacterium]|nr:transporter substrate-binding domain-containing protein [Hyphomicrobiales bacterium]
MATRRAILALPLFAAFGARPAAAREWKRVRIGTDGAYPPFSRVVDGRPVGFDPDLAEALCRRIGAECEIVALGWDALLPSLQTRQVDALVASIPITDAARRTMEFTQRYHQILPRFAGRLVDAPHEPTRATLAGLKIGVREGTAYAAHLAARHPQAERVAFASEAAAGAALLDGRIDLVFGDTPALYRWLDEDAPRGVAGFVGEAVADPAQFGDGAGVAFRREDRDLGQLLDRALLDIGRDGTLDAIAGRWFPFAIR